MRNPLIQNLKGFFLLPAALMVLGLGDHARAEESPSYDRSAAVIFAYQRIGEDLYPTNSLSTEQFKSHIHELMDSEYHVAPLSEIVTALQTGAKLPDKTVAITFNGGYESALENAIPVLMENKLPFTVFFSPDQADGKTPEYMGWDDIKRLKKDNLATIGLHPSSFTHLLQSRDEEIRRQVNKALTRYREELKSEPEYFAYPFGEYTKAFHDIVKTSGFKAAFGQQSGVAYAGSDPFALPRFGMTESYGGDDRFRMAARALPLPVTDVTPDDPHLPNSQPPTFGFTVDQSLAPKISQLSCFISEQGKPEMQIVGANRVELRVSEAFEDSRVRVNCTLPGPAPSPGEDQRWRWFGMLLNIDRPADDGATDSSTQEISAGPYPN